MKKIGLVLLGFGLIFMLSGCGNKAKMLECKTSEPVQDTENETIDLTINIGYNENMIDSLEYHYFYDVSAKNDVQIETLRNQEHCVALKEQLTNYKDAFDKCDAKVSNKALTIDITFDVNKLTSNDKERLGSIESGKESMESNGYACTIK